MSILQGTGIERLEFQSRGYKGLINGVRKMIGGDKDDSQFSVTTPENEAENDAMNDYFEDYYI